MGMGISSSELRKTKEGGITDLNIAVNIISFAMTYQDDAILLKINPVLVREALIRYVNELPVK
jgi:hypothetical protein